MRPRYTCSAPHLANFATVGPTCSALSCPFPPCYRSCHHLLASLRVQDFHRLAQRCSAAATVHFFHSMNYVRDVKGASHLELVMTRMAALEEGDFAAAASMAQVCRCDTTRWRPLIENETSSAASMLHFLRVMYADLECLDSKSSSPVGREL